MSEENVLLDETNLVILKPRAIFGINGKVEFGLQLHPDKSHIIFPLGNKIGIVNMQTNKQEFISGHTHSVSCLDISTSGRYLASGQINHMGFRAYVILWDFKARKELTRHDLHKVRVQSVCFTASDKFVVSIGGEDDGTVIVFDIETFTPICRAVAAKNISGNPTTVTPLHGNASFFIVAGDRHLRLWSILRDNRKLNVHDICLGKHQRRFTQVRIDRRDQYMYLGTMTGDLVKVSINCCDIAHVTKVGEISAMLGAYGKHNTRKPYGKDCDRFVNGVRDVHIVDEGLLLIGAGDGTLELVEERKDVNVIMFKNYPSPTWPMLRSAKVNGIITSMVEINPIEYYICTTLNEVYMLNIKTFALQLLKTCHQKTVACVTFPKGLSTLFASSGFDTIRIWSTVRLQELLRIIVHNFYCACMEFTHDGSSIVSVWNDGVIRAFTPITGRLIYAIPNAHNKGCSALAISKNGRTLVTGGIEGQVRVWKIEPLRQSLLCVLKDHSGPISSLDFNPTDTEVISACVDGSCVIWDMSRLTRKQVFTANTQFMAARYFPTGVQILSCGADGRIGYWMVYNGALIRELIASKKSSVNCVSINFTGEFFVSVGNDQLVKVWDYNRGAVVCQGSEHASTVKCVAFSPCGKFFVTGSEDGSIIIWDLPEAFWGKGTPTELIRTTSTQKKAEAVEAKVVSHQRSPTPKKEHVDGLLSKTPKGCVACVECPPVHHKKMPEEKCNIGYETKKC